MNKIAEQEFIKEMNENQGIVHKVANIYFMNSGEREDVIQEMYFQLWRSYPGFQRISKFSTWMYQVCLNTAITYFKKNRRYNFQQISEAHKELATGSIILPDPKIESLYRAIRKLSKINKAIILLYLENHRYEEISVITGLTKSNVSVRLVRIKRELEKEIKKEFIEPQKQ